MDVSAADIKLILQTLRDSEFDQAEVTVGDTRIAVARDGAVLAPAAAPAAAPSAPAVTTPAVASAPAAEVPAQTVAPVAAPTGSGHVVESPTVGIFWRAPQPGAPAFVEIGQQVEAGDTVGIVEVMKLMTNIVTEVAGVVTAVHVENAGHVEHGTALVTIEPKA